jgi:YihY family inner membrane protein
VRTVRELVKRAAVKWNADDCLTLGAALAYYTVFSLAPILVIVIAVAGAVFGPEAAQGEIVTQIRGLTGEEGATAIQSLIQSASRQGAGPRATIIGLLVLLFGSTSAFSQLQSALNTVWEVPPQAHAGLWAMVRARFLSFAAVLGTGFLLSVSLVLSAAVAAFGRYGWGWVPGIGHVLELADLLGSMLVHTLLFAMIFKLLPDVEIQWRDVWVGAAVPRQQRARRGLRGRELGDPHPGLGLLFGPDPPLRRRVHPRLRDRDYISTIPSPTRLSRSSTSGSCPGSTRSSEDASSRILANAEYIRGRSWSVLKGMPSSKFR